MKTIEERAKEFANRAFEGTPYYNSAMSAGFAEFAAKFARQEIEALIQWHNIQTDKDGFATDNAHDEIFRQLPSLVRDKQDGQIKLIDYDNATEWRGYLELRPNRYQWRPIHNK